MSQIDAILAEIEARAKAATPGPWTTASIFGRNDTVKTEWIGAW